MASPSAPDPKNRAASADTVARKPYSSPVLIVYGHVAKITNTGTGGGVDGGPKGMRKMACL